MKVLLNEEDRVLATFEDGMEDEAIGYDDERWKIIQGLFFLEKNLTFDSKKFNLFF